MSILFEFDIQFGGLEFHVLAVDWHSHPRLTTLPPSERAVAECAALGMKNRAIAERCGTSERVIANRVQAVLRRFGVQSRHELIALLLSEP